MKILAALLFPLLLAAQNPGPSVTGGDLAAVSGISLVSHTAAGSTNASTVTTAGINTTGANLLVVICVSYSAYCSTPTSSPTACSFSTYLTKYGILSYATVYYCYGFTTGSSQTFSESTSSLEPALAILAFSGSSGASVDQQSGLAYGCCAPSIAAGSITPGFNNEVVISALGLAPTVTGLSINGGFTLVDQVAASSGLNQGIASGYLVQTTAAAANPTWSWTTNGGAVAINGSFK